MKFHTEKFVGDIVERTLHFGDISGFLWTPRYASPAAPVPLILAGPPPGGGLAQSHSRLLGRAQHAGASGYATASIELPGCGDRPPVTGIAEARSQVRHALARGERVPDDVIDRFVLPLVEAAVPEWQGFLDELLHLPEITGPVGYAGGVISIGVRLAAIDRRIAAAVLFAGSFLPRSIIEQAREVRIPLHVLLQWDDEGNDRQAALALFDAFASPEKTLHANMGGHTGVPDYAGEAADSFFRRHLPHHVS